MLCELLVYQTLGIQNFFSKTKGDCINEFLIHVNEKMQHFLDHT